jgi:hypothetical protein
MVALPDCTVTVTGSPEEAVGLVGICRLTAFVSGKRARKPNRATRMNLLGDFIGNVYTPFNTLDYRRSNEENHLLAPKAILGFRIQDMAIFSNVLQVPVQELLPPRVSKGYVKTLNHLQNAPGLSRNRVLGRGEG